MQWSDWTFRFGQGMGELGRNLVHNLYLYRRPAPPTDVRLDGKTVIVTGSNRTMGKDIAEDLACRGAKVIMACRNLQLADEAANDIRSRNKDANLVTRLLDLSSLQSIREFADRVIKEEPRLDVLVNNAAILTFKGREETPDGFEMMFGVNYLGTVYLTMLLFDHISRTSDAGRIVSTASLAHLNIDDIFWDDLQSKKSFSPFEVYGHTKLALLLFTRQLAKKSFLKHNVRVYAVDPGVSGTDLGRDMSLGMMIAGAVFFSRPVRRSVKEAANSVVCSVVSDPKDYSPDDYYFTDGQVKPVSKAARDDEKAERLWNITSQLLNLPSMLSL